MNIYLDLETIPLQSEAMKAELRADHMTELDAQMAAVKAPGNYKDQAKIDEYISAEKAKLQAGADAAFEQAILKTSFDGGLGQICVIGWAIDDGPAQTMAVRDLSREAESEVIAGWFANLIAAYRPTNMPRFIGHNVIGFDFPFLWKRAMVLGIKPPAILPRNPKPWGDTVVDTMTLWDSQQRAGGSMAKLCKLMGIPGKGDIDGSKVWPYVQAGRIAEVAEYCAGDVERTRAMFKRMTFAEPEKRALEAA